MKNLKKLSKFLLAGAALSGTLMPKVGAFVDIPLKTGKDSLAKTFETWSNLGSARKHINTKQADLNSKYKNVLEAEISDITNNGDEEAIQSALLITLDKLLKTPAIDIVLTQLKANTNEILKIKYDKGIYSPIPYMMGLTEYQNNKITIYGEAIRNQVEKGITNISIPYKPALTTEIYLINEVKAAGDAIENHKLTKKDAVLGTASVVLAHELGHIVHTTLAACRNKNFGKKYVYQDMDKTDTDSWLGHFYYEYEKQMATKLKPDKEAWEKLKPTQYSKTSLQDRFAEDFAKAVIKGKDLGETKESAIFEEVLDKFFEKDLKIKVTKCLTPNPPIVAKTI